MKTEIIFQDRDFYSRRPRLKSLRHRRRTMSIFLVISDIVSIVISALAAIILWKQVRVDLQLEAHLTIIPVVVIFFISIYKLMELYPGVGVGPVDELKRLTTGTSFVIFTMIALSFFLRSTTTYSRATLMISWMLILIIVPISRKVFRRLAHAFGQWGIPAVIVGDIASVIQINERLKRHPLNGLWPVLCISGPVKDVFPKEKKADDAFSQIDTVIIATNHGRFDSVKYLITQKEYKFMRVIVIFDEETAGPVWFRPINVVEHMGMEITHNLLNRTQQFIKRGMDILLISLILPFLIILFFIIGVTIKITSPGPIFYKHRRIGHDGEDLWIWKFRSMVINADAALHKHLHENPALQKEWDENFKLKNDPRITRIGRVLRFTSLDELPQVWNVLKGEMSLIGPRPIVQEEIPLYKDDFEIYKQVLPGITGLWQISGRNDLPYQERVSLDVYYIQNWSIWLDIHILMHTFLATLQARGAY